MDSTPEMGPSGIGAQVPAGGVALLERAVSYTLGSLCLVTPAALDRPTPCAGWNLRTLLDHLDDGFVALTEAALYHQVRRTAQPCPEQCADPAAHLRLHARRLLGVWVRDTPARVGIGGMGLEGDLLAGAGALELCVHGWDVATACGVSRQIPAALATDLLELVPLVVTPADRPVRFARPVPVPAGSTPGERLLAHLGRACP
jgi:uncharacterized protein (TIGR03086 family)